MQKHANLVDLVKSFPTNIFLQNLASIQKRRSPLKFAHLAEKSEKGSISNLSTKVLQELVLLRDEDRDPELVSGFTGFTAKDGMTSADPTWRCTRCGAPPLVDLRKKQEELERKLAKSLDKVCDLSRKKEGLQSELTAAKDELRHVRRRVRIDTGTEDPLPISKQTREIPRKAF